MIGPGHPLKQQRQASRVARRDLGQVHLDLRVLLKMLFAGLEDLLGGIERQFATYGEAPVAMILASGVCQAIMLPVMGGAALYFRYRCSDPPLRPGRLWDALLWLSGVGFLIVGVWTALAKLLPGLTKLTH